jgi:RNA polymerase sigma factor (sigma-70 family)
MVSNWPAFLMLRVEHDHARREGYFVRPCLARVVRSIHMANVLSCDELRTSYFAALRAGDDWSDIWLLFLNDNWFRAELRRHAEYVLRTGGYSIEHLDDLQQDVLLHLSAKLRRSVHFGRDPAAAIDKFASWIGTIVLNECRDALRRQRPDHGPQGEPSPDEEEAAAMAAARLHDQVTALKLAIDELPKLQASVLRLYLARHKLSEIAKDLKLTYPQVRWAFFSAIDQLRFDLS